MARPRFDNLPEPRRRELLEHAANEFAQHGYQGASLNRIISAVGLSKGSFYYYFDDKADLFDTVIQFAIESVLGSEANGAPDVLVEELGKLERHDFWPRLGDYFQELTRRTQDVPWLVGLGRLIYNPPAVEGVELLVAQRFEEVRNWLGTLLEHGRGLGAVRDDLPVGLLQLMVAGALEGSDRWFVERWTDLDPGQREEQAAAVFDVIRGMAATQGVADA